jgi:hypothetical protein
VEQGNREASRLRDERKAPINPSNLLFSNHDDEEDALDRSTLRPYPVFLSVPIRLWKRHEEKATRAIEESSCSETVHGLGASLAWILRGMSLPLYALSQSSRIS